MMSKLLQSPLFYEAAVGAAALLFLLNFGRTGSVAAPREPGSTLRLYGKGLGETIEI